MTGMVATEDLLKPIEGPNPCGIYLRYEPVYDKIREARRQDDGGAVVEGTPKSADHKVAVELATDAIAKKSKDLQLAAWLADSLTYREGFTGLNRGLALMREMMETYWEHLYPEIEDGDLSMRAGPLDWLGSDPLLAKGSCPVMSIRFVPITANGLSWLHYHEKSLKDAKKEKAEEFESAFQGTPKAFYKQQAADLAACMQSLDELAAVCDQRFGKDGPSLSNLKRALEEVQNTVGMLLKRKLETEPDPVEKASPAGATNPAADPLATPTDGMAEAAVATSVTGLFEEFQGEIQGLEPKHQQEALVRIVEATRFMRRARPANPAPYLVLRSVRWGELRAGGAELDASLLVAPSTEVRTRMKTLAANQRWADLLELTESAAATECGRGWLDLQRYAITACEQLGYAAAANAMKSELACLLADYPRLASATMLDDTGTANPETAAWLSTAILKKG
jgi:type VI secretion system protein ImpA